MQPDCSEGGKHSPRVSHHGPGPGSVWVGRDARRSATGLSTVNMIERVMGTA